MHHQGRHYSRARTQQEGRQPGGGHDARAVAASLRQLPRRAESSPYQIRYSQQSSSIARVHGWRTSGNSTPQAQAHDTNRNHRRTPNSKPTIPLAQEILTALSIHSRCAQRMAVVDMRATLERHAFPPGGRPKMIPTQRDGGGHKASRRGFKHPAASLDGVFNESTPGRHDTSAAAAYG